MRISDWSSDVCSSDLRPHSRHAKVVPRSDSRCRCNSCGDLLVSRCWLPKRHGSVTPRPSANTSPASIKPSLTKRQETNGSRRFPQPKSIRRLEEPYIAARTEEHTSELQSLMRTSYAVFCLKKKN